MLRKLIPHVCIILALVTITYVILNQFNPSFFSRNFFKVLLLVYSVITLIAAGFLIADNRRA